MKIDPERIDAVVYLVCTDRGQHKRRRVDRVVWWDTGARQIGKLIMDDPDGDPRSPNVGDWGRVVSDAAGNTLPPAPAARHGSGLSWNAYQPRCPSPSCSSKPQIDAARLWLILEEAKRLGQTSVDVSMLD